MVGHWSSSTFFPGGTLKSLELIFNFTPLRVVCALMDERLMSKYHARAQARFDRFTYGSASRLLLL